MGGKKTKTAWVTPTRARLACSSSPTAWGGTRKGQVAAQLALQAVSALFQKEAKPQVPDVAAFLEAAVMAAHRQILRYAIEKGMLDTPRTTIVAAVMQDGAVTWIHCGDSRLYFVRQGELVARTRDHSFVEQRLAAPPGSKLPSVSTAMCFLPVWDLAPNPCLTLAGPWSCSRVTSCCCARMVCGDSLNDVDIVYELGHKPVGEAVP